MAKENSFRLWTRAWLLLPLSVIVLASIPQFIVERWQVLHGTEASAVVYQKLGKEGSGSSGIYYLIAKYQQPQENEFYARVVTDRSTHNSLALGEQIRVCYAKDHQNTLLSSEWSFSGKLILLTVVCLMLLFDGLTANHAWRHRRRDGYLP